MRIEPGELPGVLLLEPRVHGDERGSFFELWNAARFREAGVTAEFVQDNVSVSRQATVRGLHFQNPRPQAKLAMVIAGEVFDVVVDLRRSSPTFGRWTGTVLSAANRRQLFVPVGFAHGFQVLSEQATFVYKCSDFYAPECEGAIRWDDPDLGIAWPLGDAIISGRDLRAPRLRDLPSERLFA